MAIKVNFEDLKDSRTVVFIRNNQTVEQFNSTLEKCIKQDNLPVEVSKETIKSGGFFTGKSDEMIVLKCRTPEGDEVMVCVSGKTFGKFLLINAYLLNNCRDDNAIRNSYIFTCWGSVSATIDKALAELNIEKFDRGFLGIS